jgi:hypothetical protein
MGEEEELDLLAGVQIKRQEEVSLVKPNNPDLLSRAADLFQLQKKLIYYKTVLKGMEVGEHVMATDLKDLIYGNNNKVNNYDCSYFASGTLLSVE